MAKTKTEAGDSYPSSAYAYVGDPEVPSTWKLRLWDSPTEKVTASSVGRAVAALGTSGFRGNKVELPSADVPEVKRKVLAAWHSVHDAKDELPEVLKGVIHMAEATMTLEDVTKKLIDLEKDLGEANKRADRAEAVIKLSSEDRIVFEALPVDKQQAFLDGDDAVRKAMTPVEKNDDVTDDIVKSSPAFIELQKAQDELKKALDTANAKVTAAETIAKAEQTIRQKVEFEKKAETDFSALPGTAVEKGAVLNVIASKLSVEEAAEVTKLFVAGNEALKQLGVSKGTDAAGTAAGADASSAWSKIETLAKAEIAKSSDKKMTIEKAVTIVMQNDPKLYDEYLTAQANSK